MFFVAGEIQQRSAAAFGRHDTQIDLQAADQHSAGALGALREHLAATHVLRPIVPRRAERAVTAPRADPLTKALTLRRVRSLDDLAPGAFGKRFLLMEEWVASSVS